MRTNTSTLVAESSGLAECLDRLAAQKHDDRPISTYRLQFNRDFRFSDARALLPYLSALGITHCYASPLLKARAGSQHGYDITDHNAINPEIGTEDIVVVAEVDRLEMLAQTSEIEQQIRSSVVAALGIAVKKIFLVPPKWIVKSTAGKPARSATREKLLQEHPELSTEPVNL